MAVSTARLTKMVVEQLTEALAAEGFVSSEPLDSAGGSEPGTRTPSWTSVWFIAPDSGVPHMTAAVEAYIQRGNYGGVGITARAWIVSSAVEDVLRGFSADALAKGGWDLNYMEAVNFGFFERPLDPGEISVGGEPGVVHAVGEFMRLLRGPVAEWFSRFGDSSKLLEVARAASTQGMDRENPHPVLLRAVVVLSVLNGRVGDSATLMDWYLRRDVFHKWDSLDRALAFDAEMSRRFPQYAQARGH
ncbi:hypothetical protein ABZ540_35635 [Nocardia xishanensis]|uniref:hypothetical protein n=1 Tax=Nocardia xishanensis TaxID=238964 RepID=UPI0033F87E81